MTNDIAVVIGNTVITTAAIISAAYLAYCGKDGWGWFIVCAILCGVPTK